MGTLFFPGNDGHFDVLEARGLEKLMELDFAKAEPVVGVKFAGSFETVAEQIEDYDSPPVAQNAVRAGNRALRMQSVMQRLAEDGEVHRAFGNRRVLDVTEPIL